MCIGNQSNMCENVFLFSLETIPYNEGESDGVRRPKMKLKALSLFPLTPTFKPLRKESSISRRPSARHGPRPKSSPFRGVTHYKRTGRWEAHIWNKGKQVYLGASSTAEKAARAYDRAAIHFRKMGAELNFSFEDYTKELRRLVELSDAELETMLRKQSAGDGSLYPEYPPLIQLQLNTPKIFGVPIYFTARN